MADTITSLQNPKVKLALKLRKAAVRKKEDLVIIEGFAEIRAALEAGIVVETLFYCKELASSDRRPETIMSRESISVASSVFRQIAYRENPDGFLALARPKYITLADIDLSANPLLVVLEAMEKPGNLGAIFRSAEAAGADAVILCDPRTDIYNPNVIRASLGAVFMLQSAVCSTAEAIAWLKDKDIDALAAAPQAPLIYTAADMAGPTAIVVGTEHEGLSAAWLKAAQEKIKIPMQGRVDSLNASVSTAILIFEAKRQRREIKN